MKALRLVLLSLALVGAAGAVVARAAFPASPFQGTWAGTVSGCTFVSGGGGSGGGPPSGSDGGTNGGYFCGNGTLSLVIASDGKFDGIATVYVPSGGWYSIITGPATGSIQNDGSFTLTAHLGVVINGKATGNASLTPAGQLQGGWTKSKNYGSFLLTLQ